MRLARVPFSILINSNLSCDRYSWESFAQSTAEELRYLAMLPLGDPEKTPWDLRSLQNSNRGNR